MGRWYLGRGECLGSLNGWVGWVGDCLWSWCCGLTYWLVYYASEFVVFTFGSLLKWRWKVRDLDVYYAVQLWFWSQVVGNCVNNEIFLTLQELELYECLRHWWIRLHGAGFSVMFTGKTLYSLSQIDFPGLAKVKGWRNTWALATSPTHLSTALQLPI